MGGLSALHLKTDGVLADKARWWLRVKAGRDALMAARAAIASLRCAHKPRARISDLTGLLIGSLTQ